MLTALASLATGRPVRSDLAMTGELTLRGKVLPIGGVKEKVLAAHRGGIKTILLPRQNERELEEDVPAELRESLKIIYVDTAEEVLENALEPRPPWPRRTARRTGSRRPLHPRQDEDGRQRQDEPWHHGCRELPGRHRFQGQRPWRRRHSGASPPHVPHPGSGHLSRPHQRVDGRVCGRTS